MAAQRRRPKALTKLNVASNPNLLLELDTVKALCGALRSGGRQLLELRLSDVGLDEDGAHELAEARESGGDAAHTGRLPSPPRCNGHAPARRGALVVMTWRMRIASLHHHDA